MSGVKSAPRRHRAPCRDCPAAVAGKRIDQHGRFKSVFYAGQQFVHLVKPPSFLPDYGDGYKLLAKLK
jgi:hypothetical protein